MMKNSPASKFVCLALCIFLSQPAFAGTDADLSDPAEQSNSAGLETINTAPAAPAPVVEAPLPHAVYTNTTTLALDDTQLHGVANTLIAYPKKAPQILKDYLNIEAEKIDFKKFSLLLATKDSAKVYDQVKFLYDNHQAINTGAVTSMPYYKAPPK